MSTEAKWTDFASGDRARILAAANALLPAWVSLLLIVVIAWQLARIVWMLIPGPSAGDPVASPPPATDESLAGPGAIDVAAIAAAHLFGVATGEPAAGPTRVVEETENLQDTRLTNLSLKGTIASEPAERAVAIIADGRDDEKVYSVGDQVSTGAKLHAVYVDRVVLNENGVLTNLKLTRDYSASSSVPARRTAAASTRTVEDTTSLQEVVTQNVSALADVIRPTPYFVNGQQEGYRVYPGRNRAQFAALGLRPGDLIKDIDGQALTDPTQAMQIFQQLGSAEQVSVTVERNGQPEVIVLSTSQLDLGGETSQ